MFMPVMSRRPAAPARVAVLPDPSGPAACRGTAA